MVANVRTTFALILVTTASILLGLPTKLLDQRFLRMAQDFANSNSIKPLKGKVVVITGCTSGIGLSLTKEVHKLGATVVGVGRNPARLTSLQAELEGVHTVRADFENLTDVSKAADEIIAAWSHVDILVNNAGVFDFHCYWQPAIVASGFEKTITVNFLSHVILTEKLTPLLHHESTESPTAVQLSSFFHWSVNGQDLLALGKGDPRVARGGNEGFSVARSFRAYTNTKLASLYYGRALRQKNASWAKRGRVVAVDPGWVSGTGMNLSPIGFASEGSWGIASILYAMFDTTRGSNTCTDGGTCNDYYINSYSSSALTFMISLIPAKLLKVTLIRLVAGFLFAVTGLLSQKVRSPVGLASSSPESYNQVIGNSLYYWSLSTVNPYI